MFDAARARYTVRGNWAQGNGSSTFLCATVDQAIEVLARFKAGACTDIEVLEDGTPIGEDELMRRQLQEDVEAPSGGPVVPDTLSAPALLAAA